MTAITFSDEGSGTSILPMFVAYEFSDNNDPMIDLVIWRSSLGLFDPLKQTLNYEFEQLSEWRNNASFKVQEREIPLLWDMNTRSFAGILMVLSLLCSLSCLLPKSVFCFNIVMEVKTTRSIGIWFIICPSNCGWIVDRMLISTTSHKKKIS